jgi:hypothetical protein
VITDAVAAAGLLAGIISMFLSGRQRSVERQSTARFLVEMDRCHEECLRQIGQVADEFAASQRAAQSSAELLNDGRLAVSERTRALRMLRSGKATDTTAREMRLGRREVELLAKVSTLLAKN